MNEKTIQVIRVKQVKEKDFKADYIEGKMNNPWSLYKVLKAYLEGEDREHFVVLCLNTKNEINAISTISIGTLNSAIIHPREVFKIAILSNSHKIVIAHNHPSGDLTPSEEDKNITRRLKECGEILGIQILDHIIVSDYRYFSFKENFIIF